MRRRTKTTMVLSVPLLLLLSLAPLAVLGMLHGSGGDDGGAHVDLVVRKVTVNPARADVGERVRIAMGGGCVTGKVPLGHEGDGSGRVPDPSGGTPAAGCDPV